MPVITSVGPGKEEGVNDLAMVGDRKLRTAGPNVVTPEEMAAYKATHPHKSSLGPLLSLMGSVIGLAVPGLQFLAPILGGAAGGGVNGGLKGALMGGALSGLGAYGGNLLGGGLSGLGSSAAGSAGSAAGAGLGSAAGSAGSALGNLGSLAGNLVAPVDVIAQLGPSLGSVGSALGGAAGGAAGGLLHGGGGGGSDDPGQLNFGSELPGGPVNPGIDQAGNFRGLNFNPGPSGPLDFTGGLGGLGGPGGGQSGGPTELSPVDVIASQGGMGPVIPAVAPFNAPELANNRPQQPQDQSQDGRSDEEKRNEMFQDLADFMNQITAQLPSLDINWWGHQPGGVVQTRPSGGQPQGPQQPGGQGGGPPGTGRPGIGDLNFNFGGGPSPSSPTPINKGAGAGGASGVGTGAPGVDIKGSLAPDIYPWSTGGL